MSEKPTINHSYGLGNRVTAMANGLSRFPEICFPWRENWHCPAGHRSLFPEGIPGVEFLDGTQPAFSTMWDGKICGAWDAAGDREAANAAYARIISALAGEPWEACDLAVCARFFRPHQASLQDLVRDTVAAAGEMGVSRVFVLADSRRAELAQEMARSGIAAVLPRSGELVADRGRTPEQTLEFASDWKTMLAARRIVVLTARTDLHHPAVAAGVEIRMVGSAD